VHIGPSSPNDLNRSSTGDLLGGAGAAIIGAVGPLQHSESIVVDAPAEDIYDLVTDIGRTGEWSPICRGCRWRDEPGAREGAWFVGRNETDGQVWETESQVAIADRGREFAWLVGGRYVRWSYRLATLPGGTTRLTESWQFLPAGQAMFCERFGPGADARSQLRRSQAISGIPATLAAIKRIAEAEQPG
jgi:ribosome-associated toxin RatA of RatAB toxin-antitoxin module